MPLLLNWRNIFVCVIFFARFFSLSGTVSPYYGASIRRVRRWHARHAGVPPAGAITSGFVAGRINPHTGRFRGFIRKECSK